MSFRSVGTVSNQTVQGTLNVTPGIPAGATTGDTLLAFVAVRTSDAVDPTVTAPANWNLIGSVMDSGSGTGIHVRIYARAWASGVAAPNFTTSTSNVSSARAIVMARSGESVPTSASVTTSPETGAAANLRSIGPATVAANGYTVGVFASRSGEIWTSTDLTDRSADTGGGTTNSAATGATMFVGDSGPHSAGSLSRTASMNTASAVVAKALIVMEPSTPAPVAAAALTTRTVRVDATASVGTVTLVQATGATTDVSITETSTGSKVFNISTPDDTVRTFTLTATSGTTDTETITTGGGTTTVVVQGGPLVRVGGVYI